LANVFNNNVVERVVTRYIQVLLISMFPTGHVLSIYQYLVFGILVNLVYALNK